VEVDPMRMCELLVGLPDVIVLAVDDDRDETEAVNNLIKRIKRIGFGFRSFAHHRTRVLLYAGKPNWDLLASVRPG
jgi:hypothetical protein